MATSNSKSPHGVEIAPVGQTDGNSALTSEDVKNIIAGVQAGVADPVILGMQIFDNLADSTALSGESLRNALTDLNISPDGLFAALIAAAQNITKVGGQVTVTNNEEIKTEVRGTAIKFKTIVKFNVSRESGLPMISNIQGVAAHKVFWFDIEKIELRENQGKRIIHIETSGGTRDFPLI